MKRPALLLTAVILSGCRGHSKDAPARTFDPGPPPPEVAGGETLYNANCSTCHGVIGAGTKQGPPLVHIIYEPSHHSDEAFRRAVALGVAPHHWGFGPMPPIRTLGAEDVEAIIHYVRWVQQKAGIQ